jgi:hypothetical protein
MVKRLWIRINTRRLEDSQRLEESSLKTRVCQSMDPEFQLPRPGFLVREREYSGVQKAYYSNLLYQWTPGLGKHSIDAASVTNTTFTMKPVRYKLRRKESVPGVFAQYTYTDSAHILQLQESGPTSTTCTVSW